MQISSSQHEQNITNTVTSLREGYRVINNAVYKNHKYRNEIDSIVIGKTGVFVIEAKNWYVQIIGDINKKKWQCIDFDGKTKEFYNPIIQNSKHVKMLNKKFGISPENIHQIIVVPDNSDISQVNDPRVIHTSEIKDYIYSKNKNVFSQNYFEKITYFMKKQKLSKKNREKFLRRTLQVRGYSSEQARKIVKG